jgi:addiction module HigA family antidote
MTAKPYPAIHPGEILQKEFLDPHSITASLLAQATGISPAEIGEILRGNRRITARTGMRISKALGLSERYWLNAQTRYDIELEHDHHEAQLERIQTLIPDYPRAGAQG